MFSLGWKVGLMCHILFEDSLRAREIFKDWIFYFKQILSVIAAGT